MKKSEVMRLPKKFLPIVVAVSILIVVSIVSFFTATNWVFLTTKEAVQPPVITMTRGLSITTQPSGIQCKLTNYGIRPIYYGARFSVEKSEENRWEEVPAAEDLRFTLGIRVVMPFSSVDEFYPTSLFTETSGAGVYRIVQDVWVGDSKNAKEHALYCKFFVRDSLPE